MNLKAPVPDWFLAKVCAVFFDLFLRHDMGKVECLQVKEGRVRSGESKNHGSVVRRYNTEAPLARPAIRSPNPSIIL